MLFIVIVIVASAAFCVFDLIKHKAGHNFLDPHSYHGPARGPFWLGALIGLGLLAVYSLLVWAFSGNSSSETDGAIVSVLKWSGRWLSRGKLALGIFVVIFALVSLWRTKEGEVREICVYVPIIIFAFFPVALMLFTIFVAFASVDTRIYVLIFSMVFTGLSLAYFILMIISEKHHAHHGHHGHHHTPGHAAGGHHHGPSHRMMTSILGVVVIGLCLVIGSVCWIIRNKVNNVEENMHKKQRMAAPSTLVRKPR